MSAPHTDPASPKEDLVEHEQLLIRESIRLLSRGLEPEKAIREMLHLLSELLGLNRGRVVLRDGDELAIRIAYGLTRAEIERGRYASGEGITGRVMLSGETLIVQDIDDEPGYLARAVERHTLPEGTVSFIALPIIVDRVIFGVLGVHRLRSHQRPLGADLQILHTIAELMGQIFKINQLIEKRTALLKAENSSLKAALQQRSQAKPNWGIIGESAAPSAIRTYQPVNGDHRAQILAALVQHGSNKSRTAKALNLTLRQLNYRIQVLGIVVPPKPKTNM